MMERELQIEQMAKIQSVATEFSHLDDDYIFARLLPDARRHMGFPPAMRLGGLTFFLCRNAGIEQEVNLAPQKLKPNSISWVVPQSVVNVRQVDWENLDVDILALSTDFMRSIAIDLNTFASSGEPFKRNEHNSIMLSDSEMSIMQRYFDLLLLNTKVNTDRALARSIARTLLAAVIYQLVSLSSREQPRADVQPYSRRMGYVQEFMKLVHENFRQERAVGFYAKSLFISPKYLSLIIKEVTGKSAAAWIDERVILEAKNLLKFSGKNVQQIAYELNFNNQSSFGKYFKHLTGMSPTAFQRS